MAEEQPGSVKVKILGTEYGIRGDADSEYIIKVAQFVDKKMREISDQQAVASNTRVAILAAMDIADELLQEREKRQRLLLEVESKTARMANLIEKQITFSKKDKNK
jgi:cell division protein ZapA